MPRGHKGEPRTPGSGRQKGTANRFTQNLMEICKEKGLDVFEAMAEVALNPENPNQFQAMKELAQYLYPKRKSLEHSGELNTNPFMNKSIQELEALVKAKLEKK